MARQMTNLFLLILLGGIIFAGWALTQSSSRRLDRELERSRTLTDESVKVRYGVDK